MRRSNRRLPFLCRNCHQPGQQSGFGPAGTFIQPDLPRKCCQHVNCTGATTTPLSRKLLFFCASERTCSCVHCYQRYIFKPWLLWHAAACRYPALTSSAPAPVLAAPLQLAAAALCVSHIRSRACSKGSSSSDADSSVRRWRSLGRAQLPRRPRLWCLPGRVDEGQLMTHLHR